MLRQTGQDYGILGEGILISILIKQSTNKIKYVKKQKYINKVRRINWEIINAPSFFFVKDADNINFVLALQKR